jgi:hypothetical protein
MRGERVPHPTSGQLTWTDPISQQNSTRITINILAIPVSKAQEWAVITLGMPQFGEIFAFLWVATIATPQL